jgi:hypothetical protein
VTVAVLANDSDPDGDTLSLRSFTQAAHGTVVRNPDDTLTYTPDDDFAGKDSFTYTIRDGKGGRATATVTITVNNTTTPDLVVTAISGPTEPIEGNPAQTTLSWTVKNQGAVAGAVSQWTDRVILTTNDVVGDGDDVTVADFVHDGLLDPGASYNTTATVTLPADLDGPFFLYVRTDALNQAPEFGGEGNNASSLVSINVIAPTADLIVEAVAAPASARSGDAIAVSWRIRNQGEATTNATVWVDRVVLSADDVLDDADTELAQVTHTGALPIETTYSAQTTVNLSNGITGDFHVLVVTDFTDVVGERGGEDNNTGRTLTPITITLKPSPDLQVVNVSSPAGGQPDQAIHVAWTVSNSGPGLAEGPWVDRVFLSTDGTLNGAILLATVQRLRSIFGRAV